MGANLQGAALKEANLQGAALMGANLQGAYLWDADMQSANFTSVILRGANLQNANLCYVADIQTAFFDDDTTLPNGDQWHEGYDLDRFTDPNHPNFWEPEWVIAVRGLKDNDDFQELL
jgi:hypothetical protein